MSFSLVTAPADDLFTVAEFKVHASVNRTDRDAMIAANIAAATGWIDGPSGAIGRALLTQTWDYGATRPVTREVYVPLTPAQALIEVGYIDPDGVAQTMSLDDLELLALADETWVRLKDGVQWPQMQDRPDAFRARIRFGYGAAADVPKPIVAAAKLLAAHLYHNAEAVVPKADATELPFGVRVLLGTTASRFAG